MGEVKSVEAESFTRLHDETISVKKKESRPSDVFRYCSGLNFVPLLFKEFDQCVWFQSNLY